MTKREKYLCAKAKTNNEVSAPLFPCLSCICAFATHSAAVCRNCAPLMFVWCLCGFAGIYWSVLAFAADRSHIYSLTFRQETSERKRRVELAAAANNPSLRGLTFLSDEDLDLLVAARLSLDDVSKLFQRGSAAYTYAFQWTGEDSKGLAASATSLSKCEQKESLSHLFSRNPALRYCDEEGRERKIKPGDIFYVDSPAYIIRIAMSPMLCDMTKMEKTTHELGLSDSKGAATP